MNPTIILNILLLSTLVGKAQLPEQEGTQSDPQKFRHSFERKESMRVLRDAFYKDQLELSTEEDRLFWPALEATEEKINMQGQAIRSTEKSIDAANSDTERIELLEKATALQHELIDLKSNQTHELAQIIGYQKASQLPRIQREFRKIILDFRMEGQKKSSNRLKIRESQWNRGNTQ
jgi:hypothetical protein